MTARKYQRSTRFGVLRHESTDGRIVIYKQRERVRLRRPVFGRRFRTDDFYRVTVDRKPIGDRWWTLRDAKAAAETAAQETA